MISSILLQWAWLAAVPLQALPSPYTASATSDNYLQPTTDANTDLYVIRAMVYEVGILTNGSISAETSTDKGEQVALTFFHKNGSDIDFSKIPQPLFTNVTGQAMTAVAPAPQLPPTPPAADDAIASDHRFRRHRRRDDTAEEMELTTSIDILDNQSFYSDESDNSGQTEEDESDDVSSISESSSEVDSGLILSKRNAAMDNAELAREYWQIKNEPTSDVTSSQSSDQSIGIPPFMSLNAHLSYLPIPFPNTTIIRYSTLNSHTAANNASQAA